MIYDFVIIGGGIVGISTARQLQNRFPHKHIMVLEKEPRPAIRQVTTAVSSMPGFIISPAV